MGQKVAAGGQGRCREVAIISVTVRPEVTGRQDWAGEGWTEKKESHEYNLKKKKKQKITRADEDAETSEPLYTAGNAKLSAVLENSLAVPQNVKT